MGELSRPFTVETYNAHDRGRPTPATVVCVQERPPAGVLRDALPGHTLWYPADSRQLAISWNPERLTVERKRVLDIYKSGAAHGHPGTTPAGRLMSWAGLLDNRHPVGFINSHLPNNAFGTVKRGERALRLRLWWQGWRAIKAERRRLSQLGYAVFVLGDFNRRARFWRALTRVLGKGYDQLRYPASAMLVRTWRGPRNGSDHPPILAEFRI